VADDIVTRLRNYWLDPIMNNHEVDICVDAANLLEEQQAEIEQLKAKVKRLGAELAVERDGAELRERADGSWTLYADDGFTLDWYDGPDDYWVASRG